MSCKEEFPEVYRPLSMSEISLHLNGIRDLRSYSNKTYQIKQKNTLVNPPKCPKINNLQYLEQNKDKNLSLLVKNCQKIVN